MLSLAERMQVLEKKGGRVAVAGESEVRYEKGVWGGLEISSFVEPKISSQATVRCMFQKYHTG